jgi:hypothetical protein
MDLKMGPPRFKFGVLILDAMENTQDADLECYSPQSDVVEKPIPFTLSFNNQQNTRDTKFFWYYNWPSIE